MRTMRRRVLRRHEKSYCFRSHNGSPLLRRLQVMLLCHVQDEKGTIKIPAK